MQHACFVNVSCRLVLVWPSLKRLNPTMSIGPDVCGWMSLVHLIVCLKSYLSLVLTLLLQLHDPLASRPKSQILPTHSILILQLHAQF